MKEFKMNLKNKKEDCFSMLLGTLGVSLLGNILAGKGMNRAGKRIVKAGYRNKKSQGVTGKSQGQGIVRAGHGNRMDLNATSSFN